MSELVFVSEAKQAAQTEFQLDGRTYQFRPPKKAAVMLPVLEKGVDGQLEAAVALVDWLGRGLSEDDNKELRRRLLDPDDPFDLEMLTRICAELFQEAVEVPLASSEG